MVAEPQFLALEVAPKAGPDLSQTTPRPSFVVAGTNLRYSRPPLYPKQEAAIFSDRRYALIEASTKSGKTHGCIAWLAEAALQGREVQNFWWVAPVFAQTKMAFRRMKRALPRSLYTVSEGELFLQLSNGARLWCKSADNPDSLYGEDVVAAVVDEASRCKTEAFHALRSTLAYTQGRLRCIGNVKGRRNWFHMLCRRAESGEPNMHYARLSWRDAVEGQVLREAEVQDAQRVLPAGVFQELFEAVASDDGGNPFGVAAIHSAVCESLSSRPPVVWGWDLAKSHDWTVGIALDAEGMVCRFLRWQSPWEVTISRIQSEVGRVRALVDSTGAGDPVLESLRRGGLLNYEGYNFSASSKQKLMEGLAVSIQQGRVRFPEGVIVTELEQFEFSYHANGVRYSAPPGLHDDCVCALALAVQHASVPVRRVGAFCI